MSTLILQNLPKSFKRDPVVQPEERQKRIAEHLQRVEFASLDELAAVVEASQSTVRRDLALLERAGNIRRTHGGARLLNPRSDEFVFNVRDTRQLAEKKAIGRAAAQLIEPGQTVIIDAGTTTYHAAQHLEARKPQIITNSVPVANLFASATRVETILTGGVLYPRLGVLVGPLAVETLSHMHADVALMGAGGLTADGVFISHALLIEIQRVMLRVASRIVFCLDHTKLGRRTVARLCDLEAVGTLVTDSAAPPDLLADFRRRGLEILVAPPE